MSENQLDEYDDEPDLEQPRSRPKRKKQQGNTALLIVGLAVGGMLVLGVAVAAVLLLVVRPALKNDAVVTENNNNFAKPIMPQMPPNVGPPKGPGVPGNPPSPGPAVGSVALEIDGEDIDGQRFKLSDYRGKVVVLDFWGNW